MELFVISILAGILTVLSPCILPLLPVVLAGSASDKNKLTPFIIISSLALSVFLFTLLIKATTIFLGISSAFWFALSGFLVIVIGLSFAFPSYWERVFARLNLQSKANGLMVRANRKQGMYKNVLLGISLGPIFTSCSPTYLLIVATVLPASLTSGLLNLVAYIMGLSFVLILLAFGGQKYVLRQGWLTNTHGKFRRGLGVFIVIIGLLITTGIIKNIESWLIDRGMLGTTLIEQKIIDSKLDQESEFMQQDFAIPSFLRQAFPRTDWAKADPSIEDAISGGPQKDGIPALDNPEFINIKSFLRSNDIKAIVLRDGDNIKAYPYNILAWHEIVNDTVDGVPVAVTFCPLCGSAIVYERTLPDGDTTFGVSGALIESNMVMFDRLSESLWQQSTGEAIAGKYFGLDLQLVQFQLLTVEDIKNKYPDALILSEDTGHSRNYAINPYADYETSERLILNTKDPDTKYPAKEIFVAFEIKELPVAIPFQTIQEGKKYITEIDGEKVNIEKVDQELNVRDSAGKSIPFYFEMWFSWAVRNSDQGTVYDPTKANN
jgi:cytochrome c biogenesis protein CcdA